MFTLRNGTLFTEMCIWRIVFFQAHGVQCVYKWMVQFQKLTRNLFLTLHGHNVHRQQQQLTSFSCATGSSLFMLTAGPRGQLPRWRRSRKRLSVCSVLRCPDLWLQWSMSFVHGLEKTHHAWCLELKVRKNKSYNQKSTAHWYCTLSLLSCLNH